MTNARDKANIPVLNFSSKGIDDNATSTVITIESGGDVGVGTTNPSEKLQVMDTASNIPKIRLETSDGGNKRLDLSVESSVGTIASTQSAQQLAFKTAGGEAVRIDATGQVGIGTSSPDRELTVGGVSNARIGILSNDNSTGASQLQFGDPDNSQIGRIYYEHSDNSMRLHTNNTEAMRIHSNGRQTFNGSSTTSGHGNFVGEVGSSFRALAFEHTNGGGIFGHVTTNGGGSVSYNTTSDYRLKENVSYDFDATSRLKQLKPARFNFIADADTTIDGFLAHEVSSVVPEAITGTKDAVDEDGNPDYQAIDQAKLVPLLVKTIQELEARITTLEANNP